MVMKIISTSRDLGMAKLPKKQIITFFSRTFQVEQNGPNKTILTFSSEVLMEM